MAPKKDLALLGSVVAVGDGWRVELSNVGKGPKRALHQEAMSDLACVRAAATREEMKRRLDAMKQEAQAECEAAAVEQPAPEPAHHKPHQPSGKRARREQGDTK